MSNEREVVVLSSVRTAVGDYGGTLKDVPPVDLASAVVREAVARAGIDAGAVGHVVFGNVLQTERRDAYLARAAAVYAGIPVEVPALTLNRLCGSGLQAVVSAAQTILLGDADIAVAGGAESMSRAPYWLPSMRWGQHMADTTAVDPMVGALTCPFDGTHMGVTAETLAKRYRISREEQDAFAVEGHQRAARAINEGRFKEQILPFDVATRKGKVVFDTDEHVRPDATIESMAKLRAVFENDGTVTAGNASGINDAAAAVVLMEGSAAEAAGLEPLGRLVGYAHAGVEPGVMGIGPVPATQKLLARTGLSIDDMDTIELNEAFAAQAIAVIQDLDLPDERTNPNGSGISIGHPISATGAMLTVKALHELARTGGRYGLVTMCIGGGQGISAIFERL